MTKDEALKLALDWAEANGEIVFAGGGMDAVNKMNSWATAIKEALAQPEQEPVSWEQFYEVERNFCPRCGKRTADLTTIHTCTPPQENT